MILIAVSCFAQIMRPQKPKLWGALSNHIWSRIVRESRVRGPGVRSRRCSGRYRHDGLSCLGGPQRPRKKLWGCPGFPAPVSAPPASVAGHATGRTNRISVTYGRTCPGTKLTQRRIDLDPSYCKKETYYMRSRQTQLPSRRILP